VKKHEVRGWIEETGVIAAVRVFSEEDALFAAQAVAQGGIPVVEITLTVPQATQVISHLVKNHPRMVVGAGGSGRVRGARGDCGDSGSTDPDGSDGRMAG
jgi:2-dehydro-3-deoxyphosphogluconate aldolase/(4S)-4-hydroxy-2-oxoglutarate aldolase